VSKIKLLLLSIIFLSNIHVVAQQQKVSTTDTSTPDQIDLIDVLLKAFHISTKPKTAEAKKYLFRLSQLLPRLEESEFLFLLSMRHSLLAMRKRLIFPVYFFSRTPTYPKILDLV